MSSKKIITSLTIQSNRDVPIFVGVRKLLPGESFSISYVISHEFATALRYLYTKKMINITSGIETIQPVWDEIDRKAGKKPDNTRKPASDELPTNEESPINKESSINEESQANISEQNIESDEAVQTPVDVAPAEETPVETPEEKTEKKSKTKKSNRNK